MVSRKPFYLLVALLYIVGLGMTFYHHIALDVPLTPGEKRQIWSIEAKLEFEATGEPVIASLAIPGTQPGFTLMNENAASPGYGLSFVEKDGDARAEWSIRAASGRQELYYRVDMMADAHAKPAANPQPPAIEKQIESEPYATAMKQILERAQERSADGYTLTREIIKEIEKQEQNAELLKSHKSRANLIAELLNNADVPARVVHALSSWWITCRSSTARPTTSCSTRKAVNRVNRPTCCCGSTTPAPSWTSPAVTAPASPSR
jgi:hypothetical protein